MATQLALNNIVNAIVNQYTGQRISFPGVEIGECPAPVCYFLQGLGCPVPHMANDRADGWGVNFPGELAPYLTHEVYQPGKVYPKGTILIWNSPHIAIVLSSDGSNTVEVFEQNADPDGSPCHTASRIVNEPGYHLCTYALMPIVSAPPVAPPPPPPMYTIQAITPKQVQLTKDAFRYNCTYNPTTDEGIDAKGLIFTAEGILTHIDGYPYYMPNINDPSGFLVQDCQDYVPPTPAPVQAAVQLVTAAPAVTAPNTSATFVVKTNLNGYSSPGNALASKPPITMTFTPTTYYIYSSLNGMLNLTTKAGTPGAWINPTLNVVAPLPPPVAKIAPAVVSPPKVDNSWRSMTPLRSDRKPVDYEFQTNYTIQDLGGQRPPIPELRGNKILIYGTFRKDNITYYRPKLQADIGFQFWFGIAATDSKGNKIIEPVETPVATDDTYTIPTKNKVTIADKIYVYAKTGEKWLDGIKKHF